MPAPEKKPLISVIIPTYNHARFLKAAIDSVLGQTYIDTEIIVINNYSEDNTVDIVRGYKDPDIRLFNFRNHGVIAASRNFGMKKAKGSYIAFLDSDDVWKPAKLEKQLEAFRNDGGILLVSSNADYLPSSYRKLLTGVRNWRPSFDEMLGRNIVLNSGVLMKKELAKKIGDLDERPELRSVEDYDYWLRALHYRDNCILVLKEPLFLYRTHAANVSGTGEPDHHAKQLEKIKLILKKYSKERAKTVREVLDIRAKEAVRADLKAGFFGGRIGTGKFLSSREFGLLEKMKSLLKKSLIAVKAVRH
jgi:glycosyltransferase involved in cell wall biosynthesis